MLVLLEQRGRDELRRNLAQRCGDAVFFIRGQREVKEVALAVQHARGEGDAGQNRRRLRQGKPSQSEQSRDHTSAAQPKTMQFVHGVTVIFPASARALMLRSYIDSANAGGTMNSPRLVGLIWYFTSRTLGPTAPKKTARSSRTSTKSNPAEPTPGSSPFFTNSKPPGSRSTMATFVMVAPFLLRIRRRTVMGSPSFAVCTTFPASSTISRKISIPSATAAVGSVES